MRKVIFVLLLVFCTYAANAQMKKAAAPDRKGWGGEHKESIWIPFIMTPPLYGDVEYLEYAEYSTTVDSGVVVKDQLSDLRVYKFNSEGNVISQYVWWRSGEPTAIDYKYEYEGNRLECVQYDANHQIIWSWTYRYDLAGNIVERISYDSTGGITDSFNAIFDSNGNMIEQKSRNSEWHYKYDEYGNVVEIRRYSKKSGWLPSYTYKNTYNASGNLVEKIFQSENGDVFPEFFKYDSSGNLIEHAEYYWDGSLLRCHLYKYDDFGNMIGYECDDTQMLFQYDSVGNITSCTWTTGNSSYIAEFKISYR